MYKLYVLNEKTNEEKVLKKQYKQAYNKNWYRYTVFKPEISK